MILGNVENRMSKRKQLFPQFKLLQKNEWDDHDQLENKPLINENQLQNQISTQDENADNGDFRTNLKSRKNKKILSYIGLAISAETVMNKLAPINLFDKPFPTENNFFKVGQKLEGVDPKQESIICVMTVAEVCGYRIKLHFDGYPDEYDFWVNADCPDLFYARWCSQNLRTLQPPNNYYSVFYWASYLRRSRAEEAPAWNFASTKMLANSKKDYKFYIGNKLEALPKGARLQRSPIIRVATVADILGSRIRIHFDGWTDDCDYWTDIKSTNIHPINWCEENGRTLSHPKNYKGKKPFSWLNYLRETKSKPVPENAFIHCPLREFTINMLIEVVDLVIPSVIRTAKIVDFRFDVIKILYDGFHESYAYWVEDDSPDIHPVGWCVKTNHPIEIPPEKQKLWSCGVAGCNGKFNLNGLISNHNVATDCPYQFDEWTKVVNGLETLPDRLKSNKTLCDNYSRKKIK